MRGKKRIIKKKIRTWQRLAIEYRITFMEAIEVLRSKIEKLKPAKSTISLTNNCGNWTVCETNHDDAPSHKE